VVAELDRIAKSCRHKGRLIWQKWRFENLLSSHYARHNPNVAAIRGSGGEAGRPRLIASQPTYCRSSLRFGRLAPRRCSRSPMLSTPRRRYCTRWQLVPEQRAQRSGPRLSRNARCPVRDHGCPVQFWWTRRMALILLRTKRWRKSITKEQLRTSIHLLDTQAEVWVNIAWQNDERAVLLKGRRAMLTISKYLNGGGPIVRCLQRPIGETLL
jgi:hypothetical protein